MSAALIQSLFCIKSKTGTPNGRVYSTMETQSKEGMMTMEQHLLHLYQHGIISKESAITYTNEASLIERLG